MGWIRLDFGLLDDDDFSGLSAAARGAWMTAYLLQKRREGEPFRDFAELCRLLRKEGITDADLLLTEMMTMMEAPNPDGPALGVKGYAVFQRDPTSADRQKRYRDKIRASRNETVTSHDGTGRDTHTPRVARHPERIDPEKALIDAGVDPTILRKGKKARPGIEGEG